MFQNFPLLCPQVGIATMAIHFPAMGSHIKPTSFLNCQKLLEKADAKLSCPGKNHSCPFVGGCLADFPANIVLVGTAHLGQMLGEIGQGDHYIGDDMCV